MVAQYTGFMTRCRPRTRSRLPTAEHIRVIRHALGVETGPTPCANSYVAAYNEFGLLEGMVRAGLMDTRSVLDYECFRVTDRGAQIAGLRVADQRGNQVVARSGSSRQIGE